MSKFTLFYCLNSFKSFWFGLLDFPLGRFFQLGNFLPSGKILRTGKTCQVCFVYFSIDRMEIIHVLIRLFLKNRNGTCFDQKIWIYVNISNKIEEQLLKKFQISTLNIRTSKVEKIMFLFRFSFDFWPATFDKNWTDLKTIQGLVKNKSRWNQ